jgi:hypothetical protein
MDVVLSRLSSREAAPRIALEAARHLAHCRPCAAALVRMREVDSLLDKLPRAEVSPTFTARVMRSLPRRARKLGGGALVITALVLAGAGFFARIGSWIPAWKMPPVGPLDPESWSGPAALTRFAVRYAAAWAQELASGLPRLPAPSLGFGPSLPAAWILAAFAGALLLAALYRPFGRKVGAAPPRTPLSG